LNAELKGIMTEVDGAFYQYLVEFESIAAKLVDNELAEGTKTVDKLKGDYETNNASEAKARYVQEQ
jgi:hypothetical protein